MVVDVPLCGMAAAVVEDEIERVVGIGNPRIRASGIPSARLTFE